MQSIIILLLALSASTFAAPAAAPQGAFGGGPSSDPVCTDAKRYTVTKQSDPFDGPLRLVAGEQCIANYAGCTISDGKQYGVTITVSIGAGLGLSFAGISAGLSAHVDIGTTTAETVTTAVTCPQGCTCGLAAIPSLLHVEGQQITYAHNSAGRDSACVKHESSAPYAADFPVLVKGAAKNNEAVVKFTACRVAHTFCVADPGMVLCPPP